MNNDEEKGPLIHVFAWRFKQKYLLRKMKNHRFFSVGPLRRVLLFLICLADILLRLIMISTIAYRDRKFQCLRQKLGLKTSF